MKCVFAFVAAAVLAAGAQAASLPVTGMAPSPNSYSQKRTVIEYTEVAPGDKAAATALLARIEQAADAVCAGTRPFRSASMEQRIKKCRADAIAEAVPAVGSPDLTAAAAAR
jgi:UrcA family protein